MGEKLVLDLETQREFSEVEGRKPELLGVSVVGLYSYEEHRYDAYLEADLPTEHGGVPRGVDEEASRFQEDCLRISLAACHPASVEMAKLVYIATFG